MFSHVYTHVSSGLSYFRFHVLYIHVHIQLSIIDYANTKIEAKMD